MATATVSSKGQITIPADLRRALQITTGDRVEFVEWEPGHYEIVAASQSATSLKGMFGATVKTVSVEQMNRTIAAIYKTSAQ